MFYLVTLGGFEPPTCPLGGGCSVQLSHRATLVFYLNLYDSKRCKPCNMQNININF